MSANTKIEWCDHTFNPWIGCTKVGPGCDNCYAKADFDDRRHRVVWGAGQPRSRTKTWGDPVKWNANHEAFFAEHGRRQRVFCSSLADVFDNEVDPEWRNDLFKLILATPNLDWLLLTKRIGNVGNMLPVPFDFDKHYPNVWLGATIVNQAEADRDIPKLLAIPAAKRFLSMEPLLGTVELNGHDYSIAPGLSEGIDWLTGKKSQYSNIFGGDTSPWMDRDCYEFPQDAREPRIHWVIVGGESGTNARPMHPDWARSLRDQCQSAGVPFLFKQWGEWVDMRSSQICQSGPVTTNSGNVKDWMHQEVTFADGTKQKVRAHSWTIHATDLMYRIGKKAAGRLLDGREWNEVPS